MRTSSKPPLLALLANPRLRDRIRIAFRLGVSSQLLGRVTFAADWRQLDSLAARHPGSPALIDTSREGLSRSTRDAQGERDDDLSSLPVIWYGPFDQASRWQLSQAGIICETHLLPNVDDDFEAIDTAILRSIDTPRVHRLRGHIERVADPATFEMLDHALDLATGRCTVPDLAARVGRTRRTLELRCVRLGIPSPRVLIALVRIFTVHRLSEWNHQPFAGIVRALGFSDRSNYRRLVHGVLGCAPSEIQLLGGSDYVARIILERLGG